MVDPLVNPSAVVLVDPCAILPKDLLVNPLANLAMSSFKDPSTDPTGFLTRFASGFR